MKILAKDFDLKSTVLSGQCFRVIEELDNSFTIILFDRVINIKQDNDFLIVKSNNLKDLEKVITDYFDLNRDYNTINELLEIDPIMKQCISKCNGYKIMKQDPFEMCISYIISQNNNVKRISNSINKISKLKGKSVEFNNSIYYLFPTYEELCNISLEELRNGGVGFRDKYIKSFLDSYEIIKDLNKLSTIDALDKLIRVKGIGLKVASCILLFSYSRFDTFPIDTWVKQFISNKYGVKNDQKSIEKFAKEKFKNYSGLAIQYMFHSERNRK